MPADSTNVRSRRTASALLAAALFVLPLAACSSSDDADTADTSSGADTATTAKAGGWDFTDDNGTEHHLDEVPDSIAAQSTVAGGLYEFGITASIVFGPLEKADGTADPSIGTAPPDAFESAGQIESELSVEALAAARPDVIVVPMWDEGTYWGIPEDLVDEVEQIAPIVSIRLDDRPVTDPLESMQRLATSLGADEAEVTAARDDFDAASTELKDAAAAEPEVLVGAMSGTLEEMYVAYPPSFPDLNYFQSLGVNLVVPEEHPTSNGHWETISWEDATKYPVDLVIADTRTGSIDEIMNLLPASAKSLPSIESGQISPWVTTHALGYQAVAKNLRALAEAITAASPDVAS